MSANSQTRKLPPPRSLDAYRLVVCRGVKQVRAAELYGVSPVRVCQVVRRVRRWVDEEIGEWLFPRRDDLRFYAALASAQIRVHEVEGDAEAVLFVGPGWSYRREVGPAQAEGGGQPNVAGRAKAVDPRSKGAAANLSPGPIKLPALPAANAFGATPGGASGCMPPRVAELGQRLAELLIVWQESRRPSGAVKSWN